MSRPHRQLPSHPELIKPKSSLGVPLVSSGSTPSRSRAEIHVGETVSFETGREEETSKCSLLPLL